MRTTFYGLIIAAIGIVSALVENDISAAVLFVPMGLSAAILGREEN